MLCASFWREVPTMRGSTTEDRQRLRPLLSGSTRASLRTCSTPVPIPSWGRSRQSRSRRSSTFRRCSRCSSGRPRPDCELEVPRPPPGPDRIRCRTASETQTATERGLTPQVAVRSRSPARQPPLGEWPLVAAEDEARGHDPDRLIIPTAEPFPVFHRQKSLFDSVIGYLGVTQGSLFDSVVGVGTARGAGLARGDSRMFQGGCGRVSGVAGDRHPARAGRCGPVRAGRGPVWWVVRGWPGRGADSPFGWCVGHPGNYSTLTAPPRTSWAAVLPVYLGFLCLRGTAGGRSATTVGEHIMRKIQVKLFGPTTVITADGTALSDLGGIKPRQVLEILALAVGTPVSKDRLVEQLWGDNPPRPYTGTLENYISLLRRKMGIAPGPGSALATTPNGDLLDATPGAGDPHPVPPLTPPPPGPPPPRSGHPPTRSPGRPRPPRAPRPCDALAATEQALGLITGELLASEPYAEWAGDERAQFATEYLTACNRAADHALHAGDPHTAITLARAAIETDQISETAWQLLIRGLSAIGARSEALRAYLDLRATLIEALGTEPSTTSRALYLDLLAEDRDQTTPATSINEVKTLLALLRDALDDLPHLDLSVNDRKLTARAERLVAAA